MSVSRSQLADIQRRKRATPAGELELEAGDRYMTDLFEMSIEQLRHTGGNTESYLRIYSGNPPSVEITTKEDTPHA